MASYRKALAIKPDYAEAHSNLGNALRDLGKLDEAVASYGQALAIKPDYADAHNNLGVVLSRLGRWSDALEHYQKAHKLALTYPLVHSKLGYALNALARREEALQHFAENMRLNTAERQNIPVDGMNSFIYKPKIKHDIEQFTYLASFNTDRGLHGPSISPRVQMPLWRPESCYGRLLAVHLPDSHWRAEHR